MSVDPLWFALTADLFINLSAGWFAAALLIPSPKTLTWWLLLINVFFGIVSLVIAYNLRQIATL